jgi:hypothetical protein
MTSIAEMKATVLGIAIPRIRSSPPIARSIGCRWARIPLPMRVNLGALTRSAGLAEGSNTIKLRRLRCIRILIASCPLEGRYHATKSVYDNGLIEGDLGAVTGKLAEDGERRADQQPAATSRR